jgi:hypothetical protein
MDANGRELMEKGTANEREWTRIDGKGNRE